MKEFFEIVTKVKKQFRKKNKNIPLFKIPGMGKYRVSDRDIMGKRGWMVYPRSSAGKGNAFGWLKEEAARCGIELDVLIDDELSAVAGERLKVLRCGEEMERPDFVVMRHYDTTLAVHFERMGIRVINTPQAMDISRNKMLTHQLFVRNGIPTPETLYTSLRTPEQHLSSSTKCAGKVEGTVDLYEINTFNEEKDHVLHAMWRTNSRRLGLLHQLWCAS